VKELEDEFYPRKNTKGHEKNEEYLAPRRKDAKEKRRELARRHGDAGEVLGMILDRMQPRKRI
jgi:hypothetical protein